MTDSVRVYVNARPVDVPAGGTALDAVRSFDPGLAGQVAEGTRAIMDSRGLPVDASSAIGMGAIFRVVYARAASEE